MKKLLLVLSLALLGTGCAGQSGSPLLGSNTTTEVEYYNKIISETEYLNTYVDGMAERHAAAVAGVTEDGFPVDTEEKIAQQYAGHDELTATMADDAKKDLLEADLKVDNSEAQAALEPKIERYLNLMNESGGLFSQLADYYGREQYKDDAGAKGKELREQLTGKLEELDIAQVELFDLLEEYQDKLGSTFDANSTDPWEVVGSATETLSDDVEKAAEASDSWYTAYATSEQAGDVKPLEDAFATLSADYTTYEGKVETADVASLELSYFEDYMEAVQAFSQHYETVVRDIKNNDLTDIDTAIASDEINKDSVYNLYNDVIDAHNDVVDEINLKASLPQ